MLQDQKCIFGYPDFWSEVYTKFSTAFDAIGQDLKLATAMLNVAHSRISNQQQAGQYMLASLSMSSMLELIILAGNGAGVGAMKIARGMFETAVIAEYLRTHPEEMADYAEYRHVILWNRMQDYPEASSPERAKKIEDNFNNVKWRFANRKGKVRNQWNQHSIAAMAETVGRTEQYNKVYRIGASMHHGNAEALLSHTENLPEGKIKFVVDDIPSFKWVLQALVSGHVYLLQSLETFEESLCLGFGEPIASANRVFQSVWKSE